MLSGGRFKLSWSVTVLFLGCYSVTNHTELFAHRLNSKSAKTTAPAKILFLRYRCIESLPQCINLRHYFRYVNILTEKIKLGCL